MAKGTFFEHGDRLLTAAAFAFVLDAELKRCGRAQQFLTLVEIRATADKDRADIAVDTLIPDLCTLVIPELRDTDLLGHTGCGTLAVALLESDYEPSLRVIDRLVRRVESLLPPSAVRIAIGAATYPAHAVNAAALAREALSRPVAAGQQGTARTNETN